MALPSETLSQTLDLENFATTSRSCCQQNSSTVELVDHSHDGRLIVAVYYTSVDRNALTPLLRILVDLLYNLFLQLGSKKGSPYSITEHRVPGLIPVLGSQPAGDVSHKPDGRLPLLSARPTVTPATLKRAATNFAAW